LLAEGGVYLAPGRANWQIGQLRLTASRLCFVQPRGVLFDLPLAWLLSAAVERKLYVVVRKPCMAVTFQDPRLRSPSTAWFLTPLLGQWLAHLNDLLGLLGLAPPSPSEPEASATGRPPSAPARPASRPFSGAPGGGLQLGSLRPTPSEPEASATGRPPSAPVRSAPRPFSGAPGGGLQLGSLRPPGGHPANTPLPAPTTVARPAAEGRVLRPPSSAVHTGSLPPLSTRDLARLGKQLDGASRAVLEHLAAASYATIRDLAAVVEPVIAGASDMDVLFCIRQNINPTAQALLGRPVLFFVEAQADQVTGEQVSFSWWLAGRRGRAPQWVECEAEVFDEGEQILVVVELAGSSGRGVDCAVEEERLTVCAVEAERRWRSLVALPAAVDPQPVARRFNNGVLSIYLRKQAKGS
jgi:HSP20 family molecular chaperone IbpA